MSTQKIEHTIGSGNVYQDLGFVNSEERIVKAKFAMRINDIIEKRKLTQTEAGKVLGVNQPKISALANGQLNGFSMERLIHFLNLLNQDVEITIKTKPDNCTNHGRLNVAFA